MARLYRVVPYLEDAPVGEPGHPLHVPASSGAHRIDNPGAYRVLYLRGEPAGAVAEAFGWAPRWDRALFRGPPSLPGSVRALVTYSLTDADVCNLDDAECLLELGLPPSHVVTRDRTVTQAWALAVFERGEFAGVRWWSYYDPSWGSFGLWNVTKLTVEAVTPLRTTSPAVLEAAAVIVRIVM